MKAVRSFLDDIDQPRTREDSMVDCTDINICYRSVEDFIIRADDAGMQVHFIKTFRDKPQAAHTYLLT